MPFFLHTFFLLLPLSTFEIESEQNKRFDVHIVFMLSRSGG